VATNLCGRLPCCAPAGPGHSQWHASFLSGHAVISLLTTACAPCHSPLADSRARA
jgi:hypothetical protein